MLIWLRFKIPSFGLIGVGYDPLGKDLKSPPFKVVFLFDAPYLLMQCFHDGIWLGFSGAILIGY